MARHPWLAGAAIVALAAGNPAHAQQQPPSDIIVTAPTPLLDVGEGSLPYPAQTASDEELERAHATDLTDYLKRMTGGVFVNETQNNPLQPDINYRGFTASPLLGTPQGLSVYMDGVRLNQPFGDVVSWDLIPKSAIRSISLVPGSNPLFGRNSLGGALSIRTKDGVSDPGFEIEGSVGSFNRRTMEAQAGGATRSGFNWFVSGDIFDERGWRQFSPSTAYQTFGKVGWSDTATSVALSASYADTDLNGNGLQEQRLLAADRTSIYTQPDNTRNRAGLINLTARHSFSDAFSLSGNAYWRRIKTRTYNGDVNDDALGENLYQPSAGERAALAAAGITGFPVSGETQANTPFPKYRCIANALLNSEPNEKCNGLINRSATDQDEWGATLEATLRSPVMGLGNTLTVGLSYADSSADFAQSSQFAYLTPDRGVVGVTGPGAFADGTQDSENAFDARVDLHGRTTSFGVYATDSLALTRTLRVDLSARYDRTTVRNRDRITPGGGTGSLDGDHVFASFNPALAVRWTPSRLFGLDAAIAQTSRAPSAIELGCSDPASPCRLPNALAGDPPLDQVIATTLEAGIHGGSDRHVAWRVGAFRTDSRNDILFVADDASGFGYFRNFGRTRRQGVDVDARATLGRWTLSGHYTWLDATYRSPEVVNGSGNSSNDGPAPGFDGTIAIAKGDRIPLIPQHIVKAAVGWRPIDLLTLDLDMIAVSSSYARGNENNAHQPDGLYYLGAGSTRPYAVVNFGAELHPLKAVTVAVQINNLFDKHYATAAQLAATAFNAGGSFVARPFAAPVIDGERPLVSSTFYAPGAPRSVQVSVRLRL
ncbi:TonB-dependent receptor [Sphingomonas immobilis]|uniref:TonB-dependent receptor n=1 Tax=Sphingomonas immobilis TaxID=3063997 RepID=A0ABT9A3J9_9SPHN|nr:TonB-dependent receptor [Sphingomonas sp. CA1-15]MDO7843919.1 TonB-dependent receptor [Sphingomonas sp. CA1-15]